MDQSDDQSAKPRPAHLFKPGQSGNPGGRPKGARTKLQGDFLRELADDFEANGADAIAKCRAKNPDKYLAIIASLMPKEVDVRRTAEDLTDDELAAIVAKLGEQLRAEGVLRAEPGAGDPEAAPRRSELPPVH